MNHVIKNARPRRPIGLTPLPSLPPSNESNDGGTASHPAVPAVAISCSPPNSPLRLAISSFSPKNWSPKTGVISFLNLVESRALFQYCCDPEIPHFFPHGVALACRASRVFVDPCETGFKSLYYWSPNRIETKDTGVG